MVDTVWERNCENMDAVPLNQSKKVCKHDWRPGQANASITPTIAYGHPFMSDNVGKDKVSMTAKEQISQ